MDVWAGRIFQITKNNLLPGKKTTVWELAIEMGCWVQCLHQREQGLGRLSIRAERGGGEGITAFSFTGLHFPGNAPQVGKLSCFSRKRGKLPRFNKDLSGLLFQVYCNLHHTLTILRKN